jgi:hypothetical protein
VGPSHNGSSENPLHPSYRLLPKTRFILPIVTNTWETRMPMNVPRNHLAGAAVNGKIYAIGGRVGWSFVGSSAVDTVEEYDPAADRWRVRSRMIYPRSGMAYGPDGRLVYTVGGEYLDTEMVGVFRNFEAYDPARDRWYSLPPMSVPRHGFAGGVIGNRFHAVSGQLQSGTGGGGPGPPKRTRRSRSSARPARPRVDNDRGHKINRTTQSCRGEASQSSCCSAR